MKGISYFCELPTTIDPSNKISIHALTPDGTEQEYADAQVCTPTETQISMQPNKISFSDVFPDKYYYDAVVWAIDKGITTRTGNGSTFSPDSSCTRAQIVTFLWWAAGSPETESENPFIDVSPDAYYSGAVRWTVEEGVTSGTSATTFSPDTTCTRVQAVTFLHRANGFAASSTGTAFTDVPAGAYYENAVSWAMENNITKGTGANVFSPDIDCTRAQIVTFLYRANNQ